MSQKKKSKCLINIQKYNTNYQEDKNQNNGTRFHQIQL